MKTLSHWSVATYETFYAVKFRDMTIMRTPSELGATPQNEAHATLAAAAPDLLAALRECASVLQSRFATPNTIEGRIATKAMNTARSAIAKAESKALYITYKSRCQYCGLKQCAGACAEIGL